MDDDSIVMRFGLEGKVDEKQIKQEIDKSVAQRDKIIKEYYDGGAGIGKH